MSTSRRALSPAELLYVARPLRAAARHRRDARGVPAPWRASGESPAGVAARRWCRCIWLPAAAVRLDVHLDARRRADLARAAGRTRCHLAARTKARRTSGPAQELTELSILPPASCGLWSLWRLVLGVAVIASRVRHRRRRARETTRWELRLGPRRPRQPLPRPGGLRGHRRRDRRALVRAPLARAASTSPSRSTGCHDASIRFVVAAPALPGGRDQRTAGRPLSRRRADRPATASRSPRAASSASRSAPRSCSRSRPRATTSTPSPNRSSRSWTRAPAICRSSSS